MIKTEEIKKKVSKKDEVSIGNVKIAIDNKEKVRKRTFQGKKLISTEMVEPKVRK